MASKRDRQKKARKMQLHKQSRQVRRGRALQEKAERKGEPVEAAALHRALLGGNPRYNGEGKFKVQGGRVIAASLADAPVESIAALKGLPLRALDLLRTEVADLSPVAGAPLEEVYIEESQVADLSPLADAPLWRLYANKTPVRDLSPIARCPVKELNVAWGQVADIAPIAQMPVELLWLNDCPVESIEALRSRPLVSLTLEGTQVADLSPLAECETLERLNIVNTPVTDLTPLKGLKLTRLVFDQEKIERGLDVAREMGSLEEIGPKLEQLMKPEKYWGQASQAGGEVG